VSSCPVQAGLSVCNLTGPAHLLARDLDYSGSIPTAISLNPDPRSLLGGSFS